MRPRLLFLRDFQRLQGGHLKVWDYYRHARAAGWDARVRFTEGSLWDDSNPWSSSPEAALGPDERFQPTAVFVAGRDWERLEPTPPSTPVINLVQHVRHGDPDDPRYTHLSRRAVRICVSQEVADSIRATGRVGGPVVTIPNGLDTRGFPVGRRFEDRPVDVLVSALRQPALGADVARRLDGSKRTVRLLNEHIPRDRFLASLAEARTVVVLPGRTEGFCLPALEAMALGAILVVPDVVGNRSFCIDGVNCLMPDFDEEDIVGAVERATALPAPEAERLRSEAAATVAAHTFDGERAAFHGVLARLDALWSAAAGRAG